MQLDMGESRGLEGHVGSLLALQGYLGSPIRDIREGALEMLMKSKIGGPIWDNRLVSSQSR